MDIPSRNLIEHLKDCEGYRKQPYTCPAGKVTIGYGHNLEAHPEAIGEFDADIIPLVKAGELRGDALRDRLIAEGMAWPEALAENWLLHDVEDVMSELGQRCPAYRHLINLAASVTAGRTEPAGGSPAANAARPRAEVLIDMAFNMGVAGLLQFQATLNAVQRDKYELAASRMLASKWAQQDVPKRARAAAERMRTGLWK